MISKTDYRYFDKAKRIAEISDFKKVHIGCVAVYKGNIVGIGCNTNKTHPVQKYYNQFRIPDGEETYITSIPKLHAEINCLNQLKHLDINYEKVKLYIYIGNGTIDLMEWVDLANPVWQLLKILESEIFIIRQMMVLFMND